MWSPPLRQLALASAVLALIASCPISSHAQEAARRLLVQGKFRERTKPLMVGITNAKIMRTSADELGLEEETVVALDSLIEEAQKEVDHYREQIVIASDRLDKLLGTDLPSEEALAKKTTDLRDVMLQGHLMSMSYLIQARSLLTADQLKEFMRIRAEIITMARNPIGPVDAESNPNQLPNQSPEEPAPVDPTASEQSPPPEPP